ncbi:hypothetical protein CBR_g51532 [Chara braunii]|uniref:Uncharacterized protein n=1 Tax=Chara braunii TaxID=69332 RepID=A0A388M8K8_CHABU|nr:hypothetical protein CBR_g51532 [Chara braunii]|eukprot:GBG90927.1 hypothetical protein CBR_g51532 [Chara braunii]
MDSRGSRSPRRTDYRRRWESPQREAGSVQATVVELGKSVAAMKDFFDEARLKKLEKERKKQEKKEAEEHEAEAKERAEQKAMNQAEKRRKELELEAERRLEMKKDNEMQLAIRLSELEDNVTCRVESVTRPLRELVKLGKKKVTYATGSESSATNEDEGSNISVTQELNSKTERLCISEKRKRGPDPLFEGSPPMETPPKRTRKRGTLKPAIPSARLTRSKALVKNPGCVKHVSPVKTPLSKMVKKKRTPMEGTPLKSPVAQLPPATKDSPYQKSGGHVRFRLSEFEGLDPLLHNSKNVPQVVKEDRVELLYKELMEGFSTWRNWKGDPPRIWREVVHRCMSDHIGENGQLSSAHLNDLKLELRGFVLTPLDRNPGETLVLCPYLYFEAMMSTLVRNPGYRVIDAAPSVVLREIREEVSTRGLEKFAKWNKDGGFSYAYVIPKQKDVDRYRPICPTYSESMVRTGRVVSRGLNHLLKTLPKNWHFNLTFVSGLAAKLKDIHQKILRRDAGGEVYTASFDIKEMFSRLPHDETMAAVDWLFDFHRSKGRCFIRVNTRGNGSSFGRTTGADNWRALEFTHMRDLILLELRHTYVFATGSIMLDDYWKLGLLLLEVST